MTLLKIGVLAAALLLPASEAVKAAVCDAPVRVRVSADYAPFSFADAKGRITGMDVEFLRKIFAKIGCEYQLIPMPFKRSITELAEGRIDMMPFMSITYQRQQFARFSAAYRNETVGLVMRTEDVDRYAIDSLQDIIDLGLILGHELGTYRGELFEQFLETDHADSHVFFVGSTAEGIRMLSVGRIDAYVEVPRSGLVVAEELGLADGLAPHRFILFSEPVHFMFSQRTVSGDLIRAVNAAIQDLTKTDDYQNTFGPMALTSQTQDAVN
ncbi:hypothetical protein GCM10011316_22360 [Roseibium aquae]|uniref:Solute-binding protein family 3/N-terminal domain-containing protein n=1 Tax=Roseibium aquae TaxID=1323746 RepID=A0A916TJT5_9HYPH|nr:transporter substrate-binding domain-containing protein [Roseibium aquae]GGB49772.1 hypothetical protein GCM10011316_22360 [Roseibium aquae]